MATVAELRTCDGFTVETPDGCLGWVEETWLDAADHPVALAVRTADGRRALLRADAVQAVDPDAQEVVVAAGAELLELDAPRVERLEDEPAAAWRPTGATVAAAPAAAHEAPSAPGLAAARAATARHERPLWQTIAFAFGVLASLIAFEIGLAFGAAVLVTGHAV